MLRTISGRAYEFQTASSGVPDRDGLTLEVWSDEELLIEVFRDDANNRVTFTAYRQDLPLDLVEQAILDAKQRL